MHFMRVIRQCEAAVRQPEGLRVIRAPPIDFSDDAGEVRGLKLFFLNRFGSRIRIDRFPDFGQDRLRHENKQDRQSQDGGKSSEEDSKRMGSHRRPPYGQNILPKLYQTISHLSSGTFRKSASSICRIFQKNILFAKEWPKSIEK